MEKETVPEEVKEGVGSPSVASIPAPAKPPTDQKKFIDDSGDEFYRDYNFLKITQPFHNEFHAKKDLTIKWESDAPIFKLTVVNNSDRTEPQIANEILLRKQGSYKMSYTIPASKLVEGSRYKIHLTAMNGTNHRHPDYKEVFYSYNSTGGLIFYINTLKPPTIKYPLNQQILPHDDIMLSWEGQLFEKISYENQMPYYYISLIDITGKGQSTVFDKSMNPLTQSYLVPKTDLKAGHTYEFRVMVRLVGWINNSDYTKVAKTVFSIENPKQIDLINP